VVEHADSLVGKVVNGEEIKELIGNVRFTHGNVRVWCDEATHFTRSGRVQLRGNVLVTDDSVKLRAPTGTYYLSDRRAEAFEGIMLEDVGVTLTARNGKYFVGPKQAQFWTNVVVQEAGSTVTADSLTYDRVEKHSIAKRKVVVRQPKDHLTITGTHLEHWTERQISRMTGGPVLVQFDTSASGAVDTLVVYSRVMESYRGTPRRMTAIDSVRVIREELAALAGFAQFSPTGDSVILRSSPVIWYGQAQFSGDSINVFMKSRVLEEVLVMGHAFGASRVDSLGEVRFDQLSGENMRMHFAERQLQSVEVERRATSLYHLFEDSLANGLNKTSGDRVEMSFEEGKLASISVSGGVEGQYVPENLLKGKEASYHLPGFVWRDDRPHFRPQDVIAVTGSGGDGSR
jgi:lipopolysaccharide export system protein LptA